MALTRCTRRYDPAGQFFRSCGDSCALPLTWATAGDHLFGPAQHRAGCRAHYRRAALFDRTTRIADTASSAMSFAPAGGASSQSQVRS
jgi:hypothetical protein